MSAAQYNYYPYEGITYSSWPTDPLWKALPGLEVDPSETGLHDERQDLIGTTANPCAFWAADKTYLYFRMRVHLADPGAFTNWQDSMFAYVDQVGKGTVNKPDYAFAWDTKGPAGNAGAIKDHGLEMQVLSTFSDKWNGVTTDDIDGKVAEKVSPPDFNLTGNGFVRAVTGGAVISGNNTSFIDFAISWNYLESQTSLRQSGQTWRIQMATSHEATDHVAPNEDVIGGTTTASLPADISTAFWSSPISVTIPEPTALLLLGAAGTLGLARRRRR